VLELEMQGKEMGAPLRWLYGEAVSGSCRRDPAWFGVSFQLAGTRLLLSSHA
jgi:hypothetical protein